MSSMTVYFLYIFEGKFEFGVPVTEYYNSSTGIFFTAHEKVSSVLKVCLSTPLSQTKLKSGVSAVLRRTARSFTPLHSSTINPLTGFSSYDKHTWHPVDLIWHWGSIRLDLNVNLWCAQNAWINVFIASTWCQILHPVEDEKPEKWSLYSLNATTEANMHSKIVPGKPRWSAEKLRGRLASFHTATS